jgi:hypothetical protein
MFFSLTSSVARAIRPREGHEKPSEGTFQAVQQTSLLLSFES